VEIRLPDDDGARVDEPLDGGGGALRDEIREP
jgi:hypothetical protein